MHRKKPCGAGLRPQEQCHWKNASGRTDVNPSKNGPQLTALGSLLARALFNKLWLRLSELLQKRSQPLTSGRALNIEPILSQIPEETLQGLKLRKEF